MAEAPPTPQPARTLSPQARWVWRANWAVGALVALVVARMLAGPLPDGWDPVLWALPLAALLVGAPLVPALQWRRWRWEVREQEIDLRRGVLRLRRTLIPMGRVQHVETTRGVLEQALGLATVAVHTAAGSHTIPLLRDEDAGLVRARIAALARTDDGDAPPAREPRLQPADPPWDG
jgi:membrane protein YdbS with pleckstrin-like domain